MGAEFRVNTYQSNWQREPDVIAFADGSFLVVWESYYNNYDDGIVTTYVAGQRFNAAGAKVGGEIVFDAVDGANSSSVRATKLTDGGFVLTWTYDDYDAIFSLKTKVYVQAFNADGTARFNAVRVDTVASNDAVLPEAIATAGGGFIVQFGVSRSTTLFDQIYRQQFDAAGAAVGGNTLVNGVVGEFDQIYVRSATAASGLTLTIWNSEGSFVIPGSDLDSNEIRGTLYRADGTVLRTDFSLCSNIGTVGLHNGSGYDVAALASGGFVVSHLEYDHGLGLDTPGTPYYMVMRFFDAAGNAVGGPKTIYASNDLSNGTRITQLETGQLLVVWSQDPLQAQISDDVYGRVFSATGVALTGVFEISNDYGDSFAEQDQPEVAALAGGGFVVTYQSEAVDNDDEGIGGRIFGRGTSGNDVLTVDQSGTMAGLNGHDILTGTNSHNGLYGGAGNDTLQGNAGRDTMQGGIGNDVLRGGTAQDLLTGGHGSDHFVFGEVPGLAHHDRITDFSTADSILLTSGVFAAGAVGVLATDAYKLLGGTAVVDASDRILYDRATGSLYYDPDGSGAAARQLFAVLENRPAITVADFILI
jgi:Ca2+-binding RTX toxin-like protein